VELQELISHVFTCAMEQWPNATGMLFCPVLNVVYAALYDDEHTPLLLNEAFHFIHAHGRNRLGFRF